MLGVVAKLERRRIIERTAPVGRADAKGQGHQIRPQADPHPAPAARGPRADRRQRDATQRQSTISRVTL